MASPEPLLRARSLELADEEREPLDDAGAETAALPLRMDYRAFAHSGELRPVDAARARADAAAAAAAAAATAAAGDARRPARLARLKKLLSSPEWHAANARRAGSVASGLSNAAGAGAAVVAISPFTGPAAPIVAAVGAGLFAVGVLARAAAHQLEGMALSTAGNPLSPRTQRIVREALSIDQLVSELGTRALEDMPRVAVVTLHEQTSAIAEAMNEWVRINMALSRTKVEKRRAELEGRMLEAAQEITTVATELLLVLERHHANKEEEAAADEGAGPADDGELAGGRLRRKTSSSALRRRRSAVRRPSPRKAASPSRRRKSVSPAARRKASPPSKRTSPKRKASRASPKKRKVSPTTKRS